MSEFEEIAHSGGTITFEVVEMAPGTSGISMKYSNSRPVRAVVYAVYAVPPGVPVESIKMGGIGQPWNAPSISGSVPVFISSDQEGLFGRECPSCSGYWRGPNYGQFCPYCGIKQDPLAFISRAQREYLRHYLNEYERAALSEIGESVEIDMDDVADATIQNKIRPDFYIADQRQQNILSCRSCGEKCDILGRFAHCPVCFTRNDVDFFKNISMKEARDSLISGRPTDQFLKECVSAFENCLRRYRDVLIKFIRLTPERFDRSEKIGLKRTDSFNQVFSEIFGINTLTGLSDADVRFFNRLLARRNLYEHTGGIVDKKYLRETQDESVKLGQHISESPEDIFKFIDLAQRICTNLHSGVHSILPPLHEPIERYEKFRR